MKYNEDMRPRLHFTPRAGFLNDPNGLAYDERSHTYHVCFQYQRDVNCDLYIGWRHAVGDHLCALREQGTVIEPNPYGVIFSGSSVRDEKNASGLFCKEGANLLSFYTVHDLETKHEYQAMSYSADGVSWTPYRGGAPVIDNENDRYGVNVFRDPKVVRCDEDTWLMIVGGGVLRLFASRDLRHWEFQSEIENTDAEDAEITEKLLVLQKYLPDNATHGEKMISECPDLFPMGNKWILSVGGLFYVVGRVEKRCGKFVFLAESGKRAFARSTEFFAHRGEPYAMQTFSDGRRLAFFWHMDTTAREIENKPWNGALSLPLQLRMQGGRLCAYPAREVDWQFEKIVFCAGRVSENTSLSPEPLLLFDLTIEGEKDYTVFLENERSIIRLFACPREGYLYIDLTRAEEFYEHTVGKIPLGKRGKVRVVKDGCALDVFADGGKNWYSAFVFSENMRYFVRLASEGALHAKNVRLKTGRV